jgi:uncharacterized protein (UPF0276 family)
MFSLDGLAPLGIGLAADLGGTSPNWRNFIGTNHDIPQFRYLNVAATWDQVEKVQHHVASLIEEHFHFVLHPININLVDTEPEQPHVLDGISRLANLCRANWIATDIGVWMWGNQYLGEFLVPPIFDHQTVEDVANKMAVLRDVFKQPFYVENPPVNFALEEMHVLDFMAAVSREGNCGLVLDIGHLLGYQYATRRALRDMPIADFPFDRVVEVHLAGLMRRFSGGYETYFDHHGCRISQDCWDFLSEFLPRMTSLRGITLEQEACNDALVSEHLNRVYTICKENAAGDFYASL